MGNALLGYVVEAVSSKPFYQQTQETIFAPLGMSKTSWRLQSLLLAELAMPYSDQNTAYGHYTFADYPNGGIRTSAKDLSNFLRAMMMGGTFQGQRILREASVVEQPLEDDDGHELAGAAHGQVLGQCFVHLVAQKEQYIEPQGAVLDEPAVADQAFQCYPHYSNQCI